MNQPDTRTAFLYFLRIVFFPALLFACNAHGLTQDATGRSDADVNNEHRSEQGMDKPDSRKGGKGGKGEKDKDEKDIKDKDRKDQDKKDKDKKDEEDKASSGRNIKKLFMFQGPDTVPWVSDGTPEGTARMDAQPAPARFAHGFTPFKGKFYFQALDGQNGFELWKSDGTSAGTVLVKDINPGPGSAFHYRYSEFVVFNNELYFQADDGVHGFELWKTDGTPEGTVMVKDVNDLPPWESSLPGDFTVFKGELYFSAYNGFLNWKLWKTDGTGAGTRQVHNTAIGPRSYPPDRLPGGFEIFNNELYFVGADYANGAYTGPEPWKTDGTVAGTVLLKDIYPGGDGSYPSGFTKVKDRLYFRTASGADSGLWKTDGSTAGTQPVKNIFILEPPGGERPLAPLKKSVFFQGYDPLYGYELWVSDGTQAGTRMVKDISLENGGRISDYVFGQYNVFKGELYFQTKDNINGFRLWKTDGTAEGTRLVKAAEPRTATFGNFTRLKNTLYFTISGSGLWKTDGSPEGTVLVRAF